MCYLNCSKILSKPHHVYSNLYEEFNFNNDPGLNINNIRIKRAGLDQFSAFKLFTVLLKLHSFKCSLTNQFINF